MVENLLEEGALEETHASGEPFEVPDNAGPVTGATQGFFVVASELFDPLEIG